MKALVRVAALMIALLPAVAFAQEPQPQTHPLAGFWKGSIATEGAEPFEFTVQFRIQDDVVTGPILSKVGEIYLQDGTVTANSITFISPRLDLSQEGPKMSWSGQLTGDNTLDVMVGPQDNSSPAIEVVLTKLPAQ